MHHEEDRLLRWLLPDLWWPVIILRIAGLIIVICVGFWQLFVTVADHQRGQPGDARVSDGPCRARTPDTAGCRLSPREAD